MNDFLIGDTTLEDWEDVLGCTLDEYTQPIREEYERASHSKEYFDRNCIISPVFLAQTSKPPTAQELANFYSDHAGIYARLLVYESSKSAVLAERLCEGRFVRNGHLDVKYAADRADSESQGRFTVLDHGCGRGSVGLAIAADYPNAEVVLCDFEVPSLLILKYALEKYPPPFADRISFVWVQPERVDTNAALRKELDRLGSSGFDVITSRDVLEHVQNSVKALNDLSSLMVVGSYLNLSVFFSSCNGRAPVHNDEFDDAQLWFDELTKAGFGEVVCYDESCERTWRKTA